MLNTCRLIPTYHIDNNKKQTFTTTSLRTIKRLKLYSNSVVVHEILSDKIQIVMFKLMRIIRQQFAVYIMIKIYEHCSTSRKLANENKHRLLPESGYQFMAQAINYRTHKAVKILLHYLHGVPNGRFTRQASALVSTRINDQIFLPCNFRDSPKRYRQVNTR